MSTGAITQNLEQERPKVSVVTVNWNTTEYLVDLFTSIHRQDYEGLIEIVLVNNGDEEFQPDQFKQFHIDLIIQTGKNLGFAAGCNRGILASTGKYVLLCNPDVILSPNFISTAVKIFEASDNDLGWLCGKTLDPLSPTIISGCGHELLRDRTARERGAGEVDKGKYNKTERVFGASAACAMYRRAALEAVIFDNEYFDESFFAYGEDIDLDWRLNRHGYYCLYEPTLIAYHHKHASGAKNISWVQRKAEKNRWLTIIKNDNLLDFIRDLPGILAWECLHFLEILFKPALWFSFFEIIPCLPRTLTWRRYEFALPEPSVRYLMSKRKIGELLIKTLKRLTNIKLPVRKREKIEKPPIPDEILKIGLAFVKTKFQPFLPETRRAELTAKITANADFLPAVSIIILNWNGLRQTIKCLSALQNQNYPHFEVILVDNGSENQEADTIKMHFPNLKLVELPYNTGFAVGVELGIFAATGDLLILMNNDIEPLPNCVSRLIAQYFESEAVAVSGNLENKYKNDAIGILGHIITNALDISPWCHYPSGGLCLLDLRWLRQEGLIKPRDQLAGLLEPTFFAYGEDVDLGWRIQRAGGRVAKAFEAKAKHIGSATARKLPRWQLFFLQNRARILNIFINYPFNVILIIMPMLICEWLIIKLIGIFNYPLLVGSWACDWWFIKNYQKVKYLRSQRQSEQICSSNLWRYISGKIHNSLGPFNWLSVLWLRLWGIKTLETDFDEDLG